MTAHVPRYLFLSHSHTFGPFRVGSHHYARALAATGAEVVHLSTPVSLVHRLAGRINAATAAALPRGPYRDGDGVTHLVPRTLLPSPYGRFRADRELRRQGIDTRFDAVLLDQPLLWHESIRACAPRLIYRPTDAYPDGVKHALQRRILAAADAVVATSGAVLEELGSLDVPTLVIENGVEAARFMPRGTAPGERPLACVYVGALDARFDWQQLAAWALARPDVRFQVAGPGGAPPPGLPNNIELLGPVAYDRLPDLLHDARVGLLPLTDDPRNAGRSPMKQYEYLAAGLAVLARRTPVLQADPASGRYVYADAADAAAALNRALAHPSPNDAGIRAAAGQSWDAKAAALRQFVLALPGGGGPDVA